MEDLTLEGSSTAGPGGTEQALDENNDDDRYLVLAKHKKIDSKNFCTEVRAVKDIERFLEKPTVLLNVHKTRLQDIVDVMLKKIIEQQGLDNVDFDEARAAFFTKDSVHCPSHVIQGTEMSEGGGWEETQNWLVTMAELPSVQQSHVAIARLRHASNLGRTLQGTHLVVLIILPIKTKMTKSALETGRTFATLLSDLETRQLLLDAETDKEFTKVLSDRKSFLSSEREEFKNHEDRSNDEQDSVLFRFGRGVMKDLSRRCPHYYSDYIDGLFGHRTLYKLVATVLFLYFACLLPSIAFGVLNSKNTRGKIGIRRVLISQTVGGVVFSLFAGQPLIVLLTTAPLAVFVQVIYSISEDFGLDFFALYTCTGLWNAFFLVLYSVSGASTVMRWSTRSTNEIFSLFISVAFSVAALRSIYQELKNPYCIGVPYSSCRLCNRPNYTTSECTAFGSQTCFCHREGGALYLLLSLGTVLMGVTLYNCRKSPFLDANKREALADYALPVAVLCFSFIGSFVFRDFQIQKFDSKVVTELQLSPIFSLSAGAVFGACGLGFCLSLLFFMAQNIVSAIVNSPSNRLKKGSAYHLDLLVIGILNALLSLFGLPWVHAALPHSPLHVRALADVEERVDQGHVFDIIVKVRETRLSLLISHVLIGLSILMLPTPLDYIPTAVLDGLFLFVAITPLFTNQMFERVLLLVTEQSAYPPNHYIRRVPQRKIHLYTAMQCVQLLILCSFGFVGSLAYVKLFFPILLILLLPTRHILVPKVIEHKYLDAMDAHA